MNAPLKCIMIGVTNRGRFLLDLLAKLPDRFEPVAFVDKSKEIAQAEAERRGCAIMPCYSSLEQAILASGADAAIMTSPALFHGEQIRTCVEAGLHVFVAKPMVYDLNEAVELVDLAERANRCLVVDQQQMFLPTERKLAEWIADKKYGEVGFAEFRIHRYRPEMRAFTGEAPFIWEQGVHSFNSLIAILNRPAISVSARQTKPGWSAYNGPTVCIGDIEFEGGVLCHYIGTFNSNTDTNEIRIECEHAALRSGASHDSYIRRLEVASLGRAFEPMGVDDSQEDGSLPVERFCLDSFYQGCLHGGRVVNDGRDNLRTLAVTEAFIRSAQSGKSELVRQF